MRNRLVALILAFVMLFALSACAKKQESAPTPTQAPAEVKQIPAPSLVSIHGVNSGVYVKWNAVEGAEVYRVFRRTANSNWETLGTTKKTSFTDKQAVPGTSYSYTVRCMTADKKNYTSDYDATGLSITYHAAPEILSATSVSNGIQIKWNPVDDVERYAVYRKTGDDSWKRCGTTVKTAYTDKKNLEPGTTYSYTVRCMTGDKKSFTSGFDSNGVSVTYLTAPELVSAEFVHDGVQVTWNAVQGAEKYRVYRQTSEGKWQALIDVAGTSYTDTTALYGYGDYTYTVRCVSADGKQVASAYDKNGITVKY